MKIETPHAWSNRLLLSLATLLTVATGCGDRNSPPPAAASSPTTSAATQPNGRLTAALAIRDVLKRDAALTVVANAAAQDGDVASAKSALLEIRDRIKQDDAATAAALTLAKIGKHNDAPTLALLISDTIKRDDTLSKLAGK